MKEAPRRRRSVELCCTLKQKFILEDSRRPVLPLGTLATPASMPMLTRVSLYPKTP